MHVFKLSQFALVLTLALLLGACDLSQKSMVADIDEVFEDITEVELYGGPLEISYEGREGYTEVALNAYLESTNAQAVDIYYEKIGNKLIVKYEQSKGVSGWGGANSDGFISLIGPKDIKVNMEGGSGQVMVRGIEHEEVTVAAGSGKVDVSDLKCDKINLKISSGKLEASDLVGNVTCKLSSGYAVVEDVIGNVDAVASSGKLTIRKVDGLVNAKITSGKISLNEISRLGSLIGSSGSIDGQEVGLCDDTNIKFSSGSIHLSTSDNLDDYNFHLAASSGSVRVGDQKSGSTLSINHNSDQTVRGVVSSGTITIKN